MDIDMRANGKIDREIRVAARHLATGGLVAMPTETVYGLAADATNEAAIASIFAIKGRPADHPLIVHVAKGDDLSRWTRDLPALAQTLMTAFWPGPLTLIVNKSARIPDSVTGRQPTVGLRCPAHPMAQALLGEFAGIGSGIVAAPSANRYGHVSPTSAAHVRDEFGESVGPVDSGRPILLLDGGTCAVGIESTILDLSRGVPMLLRPGAVSREALGEVLGGMPRLRPSEARDDGPRVSGSHAAHYAPATPLQLVSGERLAAEIDRLLGEGRRVAVLAFSTKPRARPSPVGVGVRKARPLVWIAAGNDAENYARDLYAHLRTLDAAGTACILVEMPPREAAWEAINDRLSRAATGSGRR